jgi:hypothetical protein
MTKQPIKIILKKYNYVIILYFSNIFHHPRIFNKEEISATHGIDFKGWLPQWFDFSGIFHIREKDDAKATA